MDASYLVHQGPYLGNGSAYCDHPHQIEWNMLSALALSRMMRVVLGSSEDESEIVPSCLGLGRDPASQPTTFHPFSQLAYFVLLPCHHLLCRIICAFQARGGMLHMHKGDHAEALHPIVI